MTAPNNPVCDVCNRQMKWGEGYGLTTTQVILSEAYWHILLTQQKSVLSTLDPRGESLGNLVSTQAAKSMRWLVCDSCAKSFVFDRAIARNYNREGAMPPGIGPADLPSAALAAGYAWTKVFHAWPSSIRSRPQLPDGEVCNYCGQRLYRDEEVALMKEDVAKAQEEAGGLKRRGKPKHIGESSLWVCCRLCINRANQILSQSPKTGFAYWSRQQAHASVPGSALGSAPEKDKFFSKVLKAQGVQKLLWSIVLVGIGLVIWLFFLR